MTRKIEIYPVNRVEGDLEIAIELEDDVVIDARSAGTMYRGFENIMVGRAPLDGLVITPRICGICSTAHLYAAASALDMLFNVDVPRQAAWIRSVTSMAEMLQHDFRHAFLLFMPDFAYLLNNFKNWYERQVLGCSLERWHAVRTKADLISWLKESETHLNSDLGFYIRFATRTGLHRIGKGHGNFISFGMPDLEAEPERQTKAGQILSTAGGFYADNHLFPVNQENIAEDLSHSWFASSGASQHPYHGQSSPYATGSEDLRYSWAKAPRYKGILLKPARYPK
ncbi:MAG: nickel-dependent hydrogenase large subunit [Desulfobacterales bacterium]